MQLEGAFRAVREDVAIRIKVTSGSRCSGIERYDRWLKAVRLKLTKPAHKGKANEELINYLAALFEKPRKEILLVSGHASSLKVVLICKTTVLEVHSAINRVLEDEAGGVRKK